MKIKYFVSALLISLFLVLVPPFESHALEIGDSVNYDAVDLYVDDYLTGNSFLLTPNSTSPFEFEFYYSLPSFSNNTGSDAQFYFHFYDNFYFANTVTIGAPNPDFTYTYEVSFVVNGTEYFLDPLDPNDSGLSYFSSVINTDRSSSLFLKFTVKGLISNATDNSMSVDSMYLHVPKFNVQVFNYYSNEYYFRNNVINGFNNIINKLGENNDEILNGYDPSTGDQANTDFSNSTADLEAVEGSLFENTSYNKVDYNQFDSFFSLESVGGAILFVKSALEAMYSSLGLFGIPISIGLVLLVFTRLIGFQNFTSGGG